MSKEARSIFAECAVRPDLALANRMGAKVAFSDVAMKLQKQREAWSESFPVGSPARALHFPLMALIARTIEFEDKELINDLCVGMPIAGVIPATPSLTARGRNAVWPVGEWMAAIPRLNATNIEGLRNPKAR